MLNTYINSNTGELQEFSDEQIKSWRRGKVGFISDGWKLTWTLASLEKNYLNNFQSPGDSWNMFSYSIWDSEVPTIVAFLKNHPVIKKVNLKENNITSKGAQLIAAELSLHTLILSSNNIDDEGAKALALNPDLRAINLKNNPIGKAGFEALRQNEALEIVAIENYLSLFNMVELTADPRFQRGNPKRHQYFVEPFYGPSKNMVSLSELPKVIERVTTAYELQIEKNKAALTYFNLSDMSLVDKDVSQLCEFLEKKKTITHLDLSKNKLTSQGIRALLKADPTSLKSLDLTGNNTGPDITTSMFAIELGGCKNIQRMIFNK